MKKKKFLFLPVLCLAVLLMGMTVAASDGSDVNYCGTCGAALYVVTSPASQWTATHQVVTYVNGNPKTETCTVSHIRTPLAKVCPNGHGAKWQGVCHDEFHSVCGDRRYYE